MSDIEKTLLERGERYGPFPDNARISQNLKIQMRNTPNWDYLQPDMRECLDLVASKISRILSGDPEWADNPRDCAGYFTRVLQRILDDQGK